jgi:hypothetical protein
VVQLGEFGAELAAADDDAAAAEPDTFLFHGHEFTLPEKVSALPMLRYAWNVQQVVAGSERADAATQRARTARQREAAATLAAETELAANAGLYEYLRDLLPGQWERFSAVAAEHAADDTELLLVAQKIMTAVAARPTRRSSGSPAGPSPTGPGSTGGSDSPASPGLGGLPRGGVRVTVGQAATDPEPEPEDDPEEDAPETDLDLAREEIRGSSVAVRDLVRSSR